MKNNCEIDTQRQAPTIRTDKKITKDRKIGKSQNRSDESKYISPNDA